MPRLMSEEEFEAWGNAEVKAEFVDGEVIVIAPESVGQCFKAEWFWQEPSFDAYAIAKEIGILA